MLFTKLMKPVYASLRAKGHISTAFLDDSLLVGITRERCMQDVLDSLETLQSLGFIVYPTKSVLQPTEVVQYLGVTIDFTSVKDGITFSRLVSKWQGVPKPESES